VSDELYWYCHLAIKHESNHWQQSPY